MTNIDNNSTSLSDHDIRLYLEDLSLRSWYNRKPVAIYLCTLVVVGSLGNTWCFLVYFFCFSVNSTRVLVLAMSLCDLVTNLIGLPLQIYTIRHAYDSFDVPLCRSMFIFATIPTQLSGFLILLVAYDRYRAKPGDLSGSVHSKDTVEDTSKPHFQSSTASTIKKETWEYNAEDSTEGIINRKVTEGAISVITENKRLSEFMGSYVSTSESSEEETVTVEPGGNQAGPSEVNERVSSSASNTHKETTARNIKDSTDLPQRQKRERKVTPGGTPVKKRNKKLRELTEIYESAWEPSEKETVTVEPEENQVGPSKKVSEKRHRSPRTVRISTQTDEDTSKPEFVSSSASHVKKIPLKRDSKKFAELLKIYEGAFQQSEPDRSPH
ncbi:hypothetical protein C0Q70_18798 [Pomacea canaliculata]|uniref:G-protein coupled receptors family 1 profile domain-containing protein n=1 Tax=Pomacea canaliculata TaxID=400727 RepID=A0A2T7NHI9_POMCA|nr:hypothetical protein C0Q70_18798 [Pomacea canaliculata]